MNHDNADPTDSSDERLEEHAREFCDLPLKQPGPYPVPADHPDNDDDELMGRTW